MFKHLLGLGMPNLSPYQLRNLGQERNRRTKAQQQRDIYAAEAKRNFRHKRNLLNVARGGYYAHDIKSITKA